MIRNTFKKIYSFVRGSIWEVRQMSRLSLRQTLNYTYAVVLFSITIIVIVTILDLVFTRARDLLLLTQI